MKKRLPERLLRFVLHSTNEIDEDYFFESVNRELGKVASEYIPELLKVDESFWGYYEKVGRRPDKFDSKKKRINKCEVPYYLDEECWKERLGAAKAGESVNIPLKIEAFIKDPEKRSPKKAPELGKHQFFILTLPIFEGSFRKGKCKPNGTLFDISYKLKDALKLESVTPDIESSTYQLFSSLLNPRPYPAATDVDNWHLNTINYPNNLNVDGSGVRIGHPDTGWTAHPEMGFDTAELSSSFDLDADVNIYDSNAASGAREAVPSESNPPFYYAHHGTFTASMIISGRSADSNLDGTIDVNDDDRVFGIAPGARIVSIRAIDSVILIADINVAQAVVAAVDAGAQVISMSLGGYPAKVLQWAINWAVAQDVIVVAAAGNYWPFVVYPAAYRSCIAVGGCTVQDTVWEGSARDWDMKDLIDISAPAEGVRVATWNDADPSTGKGKGTSFATAIVAGTAALWLEMYNRQDLINRLSGRMPLQELFRAHIRNTARTPAGWNIFLDGPGILNVGTLLNGTSLPDPNIFPFPPEIYDIGNAFGVDFSAGAGNRVTVPNWVENLFGDDTAQMVDQFGEELVTAVMSDPILARAARRISRGVERAEEVANAAEQATNELANLASDVADEVRDAAEEALEEAEEVLEEAAETLEEETEEFIDNVGDTASDAFNTVSGWFS